MVVDFPRLEALLRSVGRYCLCLSRSFFIAIASATYFTLVPTSYCAWVVAVLPRLMKFSVQVFSPSSCCTWPMTCGCGIAFLIVVVVVVVFFLCIEKRVRRRNITIIMYVILVGGRPFVCFATLLNVPYVLLYASVIFPGIISYTYYTVVVV